MTVEQYVVDDLDQDIEPLCRPCDLETAAEILFGVFGPQPALVDFMPLGGLPHPIVSHTVNDRRLGGPGGNIPVAVFVVRRIRNGRHAYAGQYADAKQRRFGKPRAGHCSVLATATVRSTSSSNDISE